jgi:hypothetical protein
MKAEIRSNRFLEAYLHGREMKLRSVSIAAAIC